jgi:hypothetical protein
MNPYANAGGSTGNIGGPKRAQPAGAPIGGSRRMYPNQNDQSFDTMQTSSRDTYYHGAATGSTNQGGAVANQGYGNSYGDSQNIPAATQIEQRPGTAGGA